MKTFFLISRSIYDSAIWRDDPHVLKLFIYLIGEARFNKDPKKYPNFEIKRGECLTSLKTIVDDNEYMSNGVVKKWNRTKVHRMLDKLESQGYIKKLCDTYGTHLSICNYDTYQNPSLYICNSGETVVKQWCNTGETQVKTTNNDKNDKNDIEARKQAFRESTKKTWSKLGGEEYLSKPEIWSFFEYWTEHGDNDRLMRFEKEKSFGIGRRLGTWKKNGRKPNPNIRPNA